MTPATFRTTCARCAAPLEATDATVDVALKAHEERCAVPGDYVRWWPDASAAHRHSEGRILAVGVFQLLAYSSSLWRGIDGYVGSVIDLQGYPAGTIRRIPRPDQAVVPTNCYRGGPCSMPSSGGPCIDCGYPRAYARAGDISGALEVDAVYVNGTALEVVADHQMTPGYVRIAHRDVKPDNKPCTGTWTHAEPMLHHCSQDDGHPGNCYDYPPSRSEPLYREPQIYDGLTAEQCLARMRARVAAADGLTDPAEIPGWPPGRTVQQELEDGRLGITESQLAAARDLWQSQLRAKVAASSERERLTVVVEQDAEDEPW